MYGEVNFTNSISLEKELASLMNMCLGPLRIGTDAVTLAVNVAGLQLYDTSVVPAATFH